MTANDRQCVACKTCELLTQCDHVTAATVNGFFFFGFETRSEYNLFVILRCVHFFSQAERAGRISKYQLKLASKSGDPSVIARCKLYYSISLIQKGKLSAAKKLILDQYEFAKQERLTGDERIYKMCHGIWLKLQYARTLKKQHRLKTPSSS